LLLARLRAKHQPGRIAERVRDEEHDRDEPDDDAGRIGDPPDQVRGDGRSSFP
jgi:hypothetical protein